MISQGENPVGPSAKGAAEGNDRAQSRPLPTRERQRLETRNLIFRVALAEISQVGFSKARIEHIAQKAGVTRPTFYAHFPTKEALLHEIQARSEAGAVVALRKRLAESDHSDLVHRLADAIFDLLEATDPVLRREVFGLIVREPRKIDWVGNELFAFLAREFEGAQTRGEIGAQLSAERLTRIVMNAIFGFLVIEGESAVVRREAVHQM
ncbi:MAG: TetR family transcriptional regulator, partial [Myxococcota bacterium]